MTLFLNLLKPEHIMLDLQGAKKKAVIQNLLEPLVKTGHVPDPELLMDELMDREKLSSTGIGDGIAIPHRLSPTMKNTLMVFGRSVKGLDFNAVDRKPAHLFFLVVGPADDSLEHLRILSKLSRVLHDGGFRERLMQAESPQEIITSFKEQEEKQTR